MSLISILKKHAPNLPRPLGTAIAKTPFSLRPGFALAYRRAAATRRWFDEKADPEERRRFIFERVRRIVELALADSTFYQRYYASQGFELGDLRSFDDVASIPIVTKEMLREVPLEERSRRKWGRTLTYTGGSTGEPFRFYSDSKQIGNEWAHMHYIWSQLGYQSDDLLLTIALAPEKKPVFYDALRHSLALNIHYPRNEVARAFLAIPEKRRRAAFYRGYPSAFAEILEYGESEAPEFLDALRISLRGNFLASEYPLPQIRRVIERATNAPTISWYGLSERVALAWERNTPYVYEPMQSYAYCETTTDADGFVSLVGTSYFNEASPLIRYRIDDGVKILKTSDGILEAFEVREGRSCDYLIDKNGEKFSITHLNLSCRQETWSIARCIQVEQPTPGKAILWIVPKRDVCIDELARAFDFGNLNLDVEYRTIAQPFVSTRGKTLLKIDAALRASCDARRDL